MQCNTSASCCYVQTVVIEWPQQSHISLHTRVLLGQVVSGYQVLLKGSEKMKSGGDIFGVNF